MARATWGEAVVEGAEPIYLTSSEEVEAAVVVGDNLTSCSYLE